MPIPALYYSSSRQVVNIGSFGYGGFDLDQHNRLGYFGGNCYNTGYRIACGQVSYQSDDTPISFTPMVTGNFVNSEWTGNITIPVTNRRIVLKADDGFDHLGYSNMLNIQADLDITPIDDYVVSGYIGSVYSPDSKTYTLTNIDASSIDWTVSNSSTWLNLSAESGTLAPGADVDTVIVSLDSSVYNLSAGTYYDTVTFTDTTNSAQQTRGVELSLTDPIVDPDTEPPIIIEGPVVAYSNENSAIIEWKTDEPSTSVVYYGKGMSLGSVESDSALVVNHRILISGLDTNRIYFVKVASTDGEGNGPTESWMISFYTLSFPDTSAPRIFSGPMALNITDTEADILWYTDESASSGVTYDSGYDSGFVEESTPVIKHDIHLSGLTPSTVYDYIVASTDTQGNGPTISSATFMTLPTSNPYAPVITFGPYVFHVTHRAAWIFWTTNEPANSVIQYGETQSLGDQVVLNSFRRLHLLRIGSLQSGTDYYYRVLSTDRDGNGPTISEIYSFHTLGTHDTHRPVFLWGPSIIHKTDTTATLCWLTDEISDTVVNYGTGLPFNMHRSDPDKIQEHQITLLNLIPGQEYFFECSSTDTSGNISSVSDTLKKKQDTLSFTTNLLPDEEPPVIINGPTVIYKTDTMAMIYWETDEIADTGINYNTYGQPLIISDGDIEYDFDHYVTLTGLDPGITYSFQVSSDDIDNNGPVLSGVINFTTEISPDTTAPIFSANPDTCNLSEGTTNISWLTNEYATSFVEYGYNRSALDYSAARTGYGTDHSVTLTNLTTGFLFYRVISEDLSGNRLESDIKGFATQGYSSVVQWEIYK